MGGQKGSWGGGFEIWVGTVRGGRGGSRERAGENDKDGSNLGILVFWGIYNINTLTIDTWV